MKNGEKIKQVAKIIVGNIKTIFPGNEYLELISGEELIIDACDGPELLSDANDSFANIESLHYDPKEKNRATKATKVGVYILMEDSRFIDFFSSVGVDLNKLCLTKLQINKFVKKYRNWLRGEGHGTLFLSRESKNKFYVVLVRINEDEKLEKKYFPLDFESIWYGQIRRHVIIPELETL